jgi:hypothetical protein
MSLAVNKKEILDKAIAALTAQVEAYKRAAKDAFAAATDPDSRAENKYDTRTLEASYLARGQAMRVAESEEALAGFKALSPQVLAPGEPAAKGSLVKTSGAEGDGVYLIGPSAGGLEVEHEGEEILVITPSSPVGQLLMGKKEGDEVQMPGSPVGRKSRIVAVL